MKKILEELAEEESLMTKHGVFYAIQGSIACIQKHLYSRNNNIDLELARGEMGHAYLLVGAVEHMEKKRFKHTLQFLNFYAKQLGYKPKH